MKFFALVSIYISSLIGAGFASGLEIKTYFADFGTKGLFMIFVSGILFMITSYKMFVMSAENKEKGFSDFCDETFLFFSPFVKILSILFTASTISAMLSCGAELAAGTFSKKTAGALLCAICFIAAKNGDKGLCKISMLLFPAMITGIVSVCLNSIEPAGFPKLFNFECAERGAFISPFVYVSYNTITALPVIFSAKRYIYSKKHAFISAVVSASVISFVMLLCCICIMLNYGKIHSGIPLYDISGSKIIYKAVLAGAVITTAVSNIVAVSDMLGEMSGAEPAKLRKFICPAAFVFSLIGFSSIVSRIYAFFGFIGIFELTVILLRPKKS